MARRKRKQADEDTIHIVGKEIPVDPVEEETKEVEAAPVEEQVTEAKTVEGKSTKEDDQSGPPPIGTVYC